MDTTEPGTPAPERADGAATTPEIVVDLAAIRGNVARLRAHVNRGRPADRPVLMMGVVKADGYGHGLAEAVAASRAGGSDWLGVATPEEALAVRRTGDTGPLLCWLAVPTQDYAPLLEADVDVTAYDATELAAIGDAAARTGRTARLQLKIDTGLNRGGARFDDWSGLCRLAREAEEAGRVRVTGIWSHFACADEPGHPANDAQEAVFGEALRIAEDAGLRPEVRHLANSAAAMTRPSSHFDLVRCGIATYGLDPVIGRGPDLGLVPAMTVRAPLVLAKDVVAGDAVSYGHLWTADRPTTLGLVPLGYGDGVPRHASSRAETWVAGARAPIRGRVCMDQFVVELGPGSDVAVGEVVELFGSGHDGAPTALDWADACGTISYEIVTRMRGRLSRRYVDSAQEER